MSITDTPQNSVFRFPQTAGATPYQRTYTDIDDCMNNLASIISRLDTESISNRLWLVIELKVNTSAVQHLLSPTLAALKRDYPYDSQIENLLNSMIVIAALLYRTRFEDENFTSAPTGPVARLSEDFHRLDALLGERSLH
jgi:hypothetical protein